MARWIPQTLHVSDEAEILLGAGGVWIGHSDQETPSPATFDPKDHGHANFADMVKAMDAVVEIKKGETDHMLRVR